MIVIFQSLFLLLRYCIRYLRKTRPAKEVITSPSTKVEDEPIYRPDPEANLKFDPPVYKQRYEAAIFAILENPWSSNIKKIVDFGCAEFGLFLFTKRLSKLEEILEVDIDEELLQQYLFRLRPLLADYISRRMNPLTVRVLCGSISDPDVKLANTDAILAIEIVEHLYPDTLDALPFNIFGCIKPKIVAFTTPNADFNVLFQNFQGYRHYDHKFEWSREQFESWAANIVDRFPEYSVNFSGVGKGPPGSEHLGCCSQMAVFVKNLKFNCANDLESAIKWERSYGVCSYYSYSRTVQNSDDMSGQNYYKTVEVIEYPYEVDARTPEQKLLDELCYRVHLLGNINGRFYNDDSNRVEIPIGELVYDHFNYLTTAGEAIEILQQAGYDIQKCLTTDKVETCVIHYPDMENASTAPSSRSSEYGSEDKGNWSARTTDGEASDWEVNSEAQRGFWVDDITTGQDITADKISEIISGIVDQSMPRDDRKDEEKSNNVNNSSVMYDSGFFKSNTTLTTSTQSGSDLIDGDIFDDSLKESEKKPLNDCQILVQEDKPSFEKSALLEAPPLRNLQLQVGNCQVSVQGAVISEIGSKELSLDSKIKLDESIGRVNGGESVASTSSAKKKKKSKLIENDENDHNGEVAKANEAVNLLHNEPEVEHEAPEAPDAALVAQPAPVVENGDLANNNRDIEGNNYPNAEHNRQNDDGNDNEAIALQIGPIIEEIIINEDEQNRNAHIEEEEEPERPGEAHEMNDMEVEYASREALFDPNSDSDLLNEFDGHHEPVDQDLVLPDPILINPGSPTVVVIGLNLNPHANNQDDVLPINANPFPNWLLHLLGGEVGEDGEPHDEPHFYCQGDGIGVHPSFIEDDDDNSSSGTEPSSTGSSSYDTEADPTASEIEAISLPDDALIEQALEAVTEAAAAAVEVSVAGGPAPVPAPTPATEPSETSGSVNEFFDAISDTTSPNSRDSNQQAANEASHES